MVSKKVPPIWAPNHSPTEQLWTIRNPNMFGIQAPTVVCYSDPHCINLPYFLLDLGCVHSWTKITSSIRGWPFDFRQKFGSGDFCITSATHGASIAKCWLQFAQLLQKFCIRAEIRRQGAAVCSISLPKFCQNSHKVRGRICGKNSNIRWLNCLTGVNHKYIFISN